MKISTDDIIVQIKKRIVKEKLLFSQILDMFPDQSYREFLLAWGELWEEGVLLRTPEGLYYIDKR